MATTKSEGGNVATGLEGGIFNKTMVPVFPEKISPYVEIQFDIDSGVNVSK